MQFLFSDTHEQYLIFSKLHICMPLQRWQEPPIPVSTKFLVIVGKHCMMKITIALNNSTLQNAKYAKQTTTYMTSADPLYQVLAKMCSWKAVTCLEALFATVACPGNALVESSILELSQQLLLPSVLELKRLIGSTHSTSAMIRLKQEEKVGCVQPAL